MGRKDAVRRPPTGCLASLQFNGASAALISRWDTSIMCLVRFQIGNKLILGLGCIMHFRGRWARRGDFYSARVPFMRRQLDERSMAKNANLQMAL
jgi:hypothetical protein